MLMQYFFNKTTPHFQNLPMSKADQSELRIHEVPPFTVTKKLHNTCTHRAHIQAVHDQTKTVACTVKTPYPRHLSSLIRPRGYNFNHA